MIRFSVPAVIKFAIGVLLVQGATVLLVIAAQQANARETWLLLLGLALLIGLLAALWFSSIASHCSQHALARASEKFSRDRERIRRQSEKEKTREIKESHRQLLRETRRVQSRSTMKLAAGLAGLARACDGAGCSGLRVSVDRGSARGHRSGGWPAGRQ